MMTLFAVLFGYGVLGCAAFLFGFGLPWRSSDPEVKWHIASYSAATGADLLCLFLAAVGVPVPLWVFALVFAAGDAVITWRLWLLVRGRRSVRL